MHQNYPKCAALMLLFTYMSPSFAMGGNIFNLARVIGVGTLPACGLYNAYKSEKDYQQREEASKNWSSALENPTENWFREKKRILNIPNAESIFLVTQKNLRISPWGAQHGKSIDAVVTSPEGYDQLTEALVNQSISEEKLCQALKNLENLKKQKEKRGYFKSFLFSKDDNRSIKRAESQVDLEKRNIDQYKARIAQDSMVVKHELGHIVNKDCLNMTYIVAAVPLSVEALSFGVTKGFRKLCNISSSPKTFIKTILRSCSAVGAVVPKALANVVLGGSLWKHIEARADKFACENAESRLELEEFANYFKQQRQSLEHNIIGAASKIKDAEKRLEDLKKDKSSVHKLYVGKYMISLADEIRSNPHKAANIAESIADPIHPSLESRAAMAQDYINKWDREHPGDEKRA